MAIIPLFFSLLLLLLLNTQANPTSPYLSPQKTLFSDYQKMLKTFKIFTYPPPISIFNFSNPSESLFHRSLLRSSFRTQDPTQAHLFLVPFPLQTPPRALTRYIKEIRTKFSYWNRTLGADHFFISHAGISYSSDRNTLELKKNSIQISVFPTLSGNFVPHKDITLPPNPPPLALPQTPVNETATFLTFLDNKSQTPYGFGDELLKDPDFVILSEPSDHKQVQILRLHGLPDLERVPKIMEPILNKRFCVFFYGGDVSMLGQAMGAGCVPVVITDRPIQDLPLMDILRWADMAVFVGSAGGVGELKRVTSGISEERYKSMRRLGVAAAQHMVWNEEPQPLDAFHMVMYQLWARRHTIRYARWESV